MEHGACQINVAVVARTLSLALTTRLALVVPVDCS